MPPEAREPLVQTRKALASGEDSRIEETASKRPSGPSENHLLKWRAPIGTAGTFPINSVSLVWRCPVF